MMEILKMLLEKNPQVSDYKINVCKKESYELFYVKGSLETVRATDTCDRDVTVYVDHDGFRGDALFSVYPADNAETMEKKVAEAVRNALLIRNAPYSLPQAEEGSFTLDSNLGQGDMASLCQQMADQVFAAGAGGDGSLNSVEIFLNHYVQSVCNSRGLCKTQDSYDAMVEAIPTWNGDRESVELYEQYNFSALEPETLFREIADKMTAVKARYEAQKPGFALDCPVVLHRQELAELFGNFAQDLNYATVYGHGNLFKKGDRVQDAPQGDAVTLTMKGHVPGMVTSACFDSDGMSLGEVTLIDQGLVKNYYGSNRFGQYLNEAPTGNLRCLCVAPGTAGLPQGPYLEVLSMSGLQTDFFNDYLGGEIRLALYHDGEKALPVTGISFAGSLKDVLNRIRLSADTEIFDGYQGPASAVLTGVKIF